MANTEKHVHALKHAKGPLTRAYLLGDIFGPSLRPFEVLARLGADPDRDQDQDPD